MSDSVPFRYGPLRWLRDWVRREAREVAVSELLRPRVLHRDPVLLYQENRREVAIELAEAANSVGRDIVVGRDVLMWGGKFAGGVGLELHDGVRIYDQCRLVIDHQSPASGIVLEEGVALNFGCYLDGSGGLRIGKRSIVGPNVVIVSSSHRIDPDVPIHSSGKKFGHVNIGEGVWIGANVVIRMAVTIGDRAVVGAGSVVTRSVPAGAKVGGNPANILRTTGTGA